MDINFELYKVFYTVATKKSISKGAEKLMISQPAVTQSIKTLEEQLGGSVFIRTPKGVELTEAGKELFNYISEGMNYFNNGTKKFMSLKGLETGVINIGSTTVISENYLMPKLKEFHDKYPNIEINITNNLTDNLIKDLRNGNLDIVIMAIPNKEIKDLDIVEIDKLHDIFVSNKKEKKQTIEKVLEAGILIQKNPSITRVNFDNFIKENNLTYDVKMEVVSHNLLTKLTENGFGTSLLTKEFIKDKLNKTLFEIETNINIPPRKLGIATKKQVVSSFATTAFKKLF